MGPSKLLTPREAAAKLGISYPALKHWILAGRIRTVKTPGGHHRIPLESLDEFLPASAKGPSPRISGRNQLLGTVAEVVIDGKRTSYVNTGVPMAAILADLQTRYPAIFAQLTLA